MTLEEIDACIILMERHGVSEFSLWRDAETLTLRASEPNAPRPAVIRAPAPDTVVRAPSAGVFRMAHPADGERPLAEGLAVQAGQIVGFLQVGPCLRPVTAATSGTLGAPMVDDGALVGFGAGLFDLRSDT